MACSRCGKEGHYRKGCPEPSPEAKAAAAARMADKCKHEITRETCAICKAAAVAEDEGKHAAAHAAAQRKLDAQASARPGDGEKRCPQLKRVHPDVGPRWDIAPCSLPLHHAGPCRFDGPIERGHEPEPLDAPGARAVFREAMAPGSNGHDPATASDAEVHQHLRIWLDEASRRLRKRLDELDRLRALYLGDDPDLGAAA